MRPRNYAAMLQAKPRNDYEYMTIAAFCTDIFFSHICDVFAALEADKNLYRHKVKLLAKKVKEQVAFLQKVLNKSLYNCSAFADAASGIEDMLEEEVKHLEDSIRTYLVESKAQYVDLHVLIETTAVFGCAACAIAERVMPMCKDAQLIAPQGIMTQYGFLRDELIPQIGICPDLPNDPKVVEAIKAVASKMTNPEYVMPVIDAVEKEYELDLPKA